MTLDLAMDFYIYKKARATKEKDTLNFTKIKRKALVHERTLSRKWKENIQSRKKYLQIIYIIKI